MALRGLPSETESQSGAAGTVAAGAEGTGSIQGHPLCPLLQSDPDSMSVTTATGHIG